MVTSCLRRRRLLILLAATAAAAMAAPAPAPAGEPRAAGASPTDIYNVVWETPGADSSGSMPLGNGDVGLNAWVGAGGDLVFYVSKTDAWDAHCRLLKLGRVRIHLDPNPFAEGQPFRQTLRLADGEIAIVAGPDGRRVTLRVWVDANRPVVRVECDADRPVALEAALELWRTRPYVLEGKSRDSARGVLKNPEYRLDVSADRVVEAGDDRVVWYHRNERSCWPVTMEAQGLADLVDPSADPLLGRTFGGCLRGDGLARTGPQTLRSKAPARQHAVSVTVLTAQPTTAEAYLAALERTVAQADAVPLDEARRAHRAWWSAFWDRSFIRPAPSAGWSSGATTNDLPLRIGADSDGRNRFVGDIARPMVFARALLAAEVADLAARNDADLAADSALVGYWTFEERRDGAFPSLGRADLPAKAVGDIEVVDARGAAIASFAVAWGERTVRFWERQALSPGKCRCFSLPLGEVEITVSAEGFAARSAKIVLEPGRIGVLRVALEEE